MRTKLLAGAAVLLLGCTAVASHTTAERRVAAPTDSVLTVEAPALIQCAVPEALKQTTTTVAPTTTAAPTTTVEPTTTTVAPTTTAAPTTTVAPTTTTFRPLNVDLGFNTLRPASDNFDGAAGAKPDANLTGNTANRWNAKSYTQHPGGTNPADVKVINNGLNNIALDGQGNLIITALKQADGSWTTGFLSGNLDFTGSFYVETRANIPGGAGLWSGPAWTWDSRWGSTGIEVDVVEYLGGKPDGFYANVHDGFPRDLPKLFTVPYQLVNSWHTYGTAVYPDRAEWYVDGVKYQTITKAEMAAKGYGWKFTTTPTVVNVNMDLGGWSGVPAAGLTSASLTVDYVRVYTP